jgi:hypothetical protein
VPVGESRARALGRRPAACAVEARRRPVVGADDGRPGDRERFVARTIERVLTRFEQGFEGENADYLIAKLTRLAA